MCKACEPISIKDFQMLGKKCATVANSADIISGADTVVCRDFIDAVCQNIVDLKLDKFSIAEFEAILATTVLTEAIFSGLRGRISAKALAEFTNIWEMILFSDFAGETIPEKIANLDQILEKGCFDSFPDYIPSFDEPLEYYCECEDCDEECEECEDDDFWDSFDYLFNDGYLK